MIRFVSVTKQYTDEIKALDNVSFEVQEGEFVFIVGPSGSGKTTAMKLLIKEDVPSEGKIFFEDLDVAELKRRFVYDLRRKVGVVFQDFKLIEDKNAFENVAFALEAAGKSDKDIKETVPYVLDIVGLSHRISAFPRELSGGEKQKVAIARALANNPKVLIADEPTGNLDPSSTWDIVQILTKINNWGTTVIMSTHGSDIVNSLDKRVIRMERGKIVRDDLKGKYDPLEDYEAKILVKDHSDNHQEETKEGIKIETEPEKKEDLEKKDKKENTKDKKVEGKSVETSDGTKVKKGKMNKKKVDIAITPDDLKEKKEETAQIEPEKQEPEIEKAQSKLSKLELEESLVQKLEKNGYTEIDQIVDAGPEELLKIKDFTKEDLEKVVTGLKKIESNLDQEFKNQDGK